MKKALVITLIISLFVVLGVGGYFLATSDVFQSVTYQSTFLSISDAQLSHHQSSDSSISNSLDGRSV